MKSFEGCMNDQEPTRCDCCGIIISQIEGNFWVRKANIWSLELVYWAINMGEYKKTITKQICDKCKEKLMKQLDKN